MSQISKALNKVQELRHGHQEQKEGKIVYLTDAPPAWPSVALVVFFAVATIAAISISMAAITMTAQNSESKRSQVLGLENTIKSQGKRIDELIIAINKNQKFIDSQIRDTKTRINDLTSTESAHYSALKGAMLDDKQEIDFLDKYTKKLDQKIEAMSVANAQAKDVTSPASGN